MKMNKTWITGVLTLALTAVLAGGVSITFAEESDESDQSQEATQAESATTRETPRLDGAQVYAWNCGSCHSERWPRERSDAEWEVIMTHMRVRANLTAEQTKAVLSYLEENNG